MDFQFRIEGTVILLIPETEQAREWIRNKFYSTPCHILTDSVAIDKRIFDEIYTRIQAEGMTIESENYL